MRHCFPSHNTCKFWCDIDLRSLEARWNSLKSARSRATVPSNHITDRQPSSVFVPVAGYTTTALKTKAVVDKPCNLTAPPWRLPFGSLKNILANPCFDFRSMTHIQYFKCCRVFIAYEEYLSDGGHERVRPGNWTHPWYWTLSTEREKWW